jgi:hypothetical protein
MDGIFFGRRFDCGCYADNAGGTSATILASHAMLYPSTSGLPMISPAEPNLSPSNFIEGKLLRGESRAVAFSERSPLATKGEADRVRMGGYKLYFVSWISYRDNSQAGIDDGVIYRMGFCRRYDASLRRFMPIGNDPDYEYDT